MSQIEIDILPIGHTQPGQPQGWLYEFSVKYAGRSFSIPIVISDDCPEEQREDAAIEEFQGWAATLVREAAKL